MLKWFHGPHQPFPVSEIAVKVAISVAVGLLVGFEREWSNNDIGARTFAMAALILIPVLSPRPILFVRGLGWELVLCARLFMQFKPELLNDTLQILNRRDLITQGFR